MKKKLLITSAYVKDEAGENMVKSVLKPLVSEFDVCLSTHSPMGKEIQSLVKYYLYDHRNEIIPNPSTFHIWADCPTFYFKSHHVAGSPNHAFAIYRSYMNAIQMVGDYYEDLIFVEGDCIFSQKDLERLKEFPLICERENKDALFFTMPEMLRTIFFYCKMDFFKKCFPILKTPQEYLDHCEKIKSWRALENFMLQCVKYNGLLDKVYDAGSADGYFDTSQIDISSFGSREKEKNGLPNYESYVFCVENTDDIAFLYLCWDNSVSEKMDVLMDGEKIYTIPVGRHQHAFKINPKNDTFHIKIGNFEPKMYSKTFALENRNISSVRLKY